MEVREELGDEGREEGGRDLSVGFMDSPLMRSSAADVEGSGNMDAKGNGEMALAEKALLASMAEGGGGPVMPCAGGRWCAVGWVVVS